MRSSLLWHSVTYAFGASSFFFNLYVRRMFPKYRKYFVLKMLSCSFCFRTVFLYPPFVTVNCSVVYRLNWYNYTYSIPLRSPSSFLFELSQNVKTIWVSRDPSCVARYGVPRWAPSWSQSQLGLPISRRHPLLEKNTKDVLTFPIRPVCPNPNYWTLLKSPEQGPTDHGPRLRVYRWLIAGSQTLCLFLH